MVPMPDFSRVAQRKHQPTGDDATKPPVIRVGHNAWRQARASRAAFLIDADAYFTVFADAVLRAQNSVFIIGWDIHSRTRLWLDDRYPNVPNELGPFLDFAVARRRGLQIYVLDWDFAILYALEREPLPVVKLGWRTHRRLHFHLDSRHPRAACHHQKLVVIDDALAFAGGLDLTINRWDTTEHLAGNSHRVSPNDRPYGPVHDVQIAVDGAAAAALGDLARERWHRATGRAVGRGRHAADPWPPTLAVDVRDANVAIARTEAAFDERPEVREVERLYLDCIAAARRSIYIENQYLTAASAASALAQRLRESEGPEVVIVAPRRCSGWLEEGTMGSLRARVLQQLREADRHGRLRCYFPVAAGDPNLNVHSKLMVVDDDIARIGSANLSNRSFGLDTECDLAIEAAGDPQVTSAIADFRNRLLAEHLGTSPEAVRAAASRHGSLIAAIEALRQGERTLKPIEVAASDWRAALAPIADPEGPIDVDVLTQQLLPDDVRQAPGGSLLRPAALLLFLIGLAAAWRWTALSQWLQPHALEVMAAPWRDRSDILIWVLVTYVGAGLVVCPVTVLNVTATFLFGAWRGFAYALLGSLASALVCFALGRSLGRDSMRRIAGPRVDVIRRRLARRGIAVVTAVRIFPVGPFTIVNLVAGAFGVRFRDFVLGTIAGLSPGIALLAVVTNGVAGVASTPGWMASVGLMATLFGVASACVAALFWQRRRSRKERLALAPSRWATEER